MTANVAGTFATGADSAGDGDQQSGVLVVGSVLGGNAFLTTGGDYDASNKIRLQKSVDNGVTWANQSVINSVVTRQSVAVAAGDQWRMVTLSMQARKTLNYSLSLES